MIPQIRLRRHIDGRVALSVQSDVWRVGVRITETSPPGWSELLVAELPEPDGYGDVVGDNGENAQAPWWYTKHGTYTAWHEGVEDDWGLQEDETLDDVRSDALKMLAAVTACEQYRAQRETTT